MKNLPLLFLTLITMLISKGCLCQNYWESLHGHHGIKIEDMVSTTNGDIFIHHPRIGVFRSTDSGDTWEKTNDGLSTLDNYNYKMTAGPDNEIYLNINYELFRFNSSEKYWEKSTGLSIRKVFVDSNGDIFGVKHEGEILRSTDNGSSFLQIMPKDSMPGKPEHYTFYDSENNYGLVSNDNVWDVYRFNSDGSELKKIFNFVGAYSNLTPFYRLLYVPTEQVLFFTQGRNTLLRSFDRGDTWEEIQIFQSPTSFNYPLFFDIYKSGELMLATSDEIYLSSDLGENWELSFPSLDLLKGRGLGYASDGINIFFSNSQCGFAGFLRSTDNGATWERLENKFSFPTISYVYKDRYQTLFSKGCNHRSLDISHDNGETWTPFSIFDNDINYIAENSYGQIFATNNKSLHRSDDGGTNWTEICPNCTSQYYTQISISPDNTIYLFRDKTYKSTDNGETWQELEIGLDNLPGGAPFQFHFQLDGSIYAYKSNFYGIHRSYDEGQTWEELTSIDDFGVSELHINNRGHVYFYTVNPFDYNLYASFDNFASYQLVLPDVSVKDIVSDFEGNIYLATSEGVLFTEDDGMTWQGFNDGLPLPIYISDIYIDQDQYLYLGMEDYDIYKTAFPVAEKNLVF